MEKDRKKLRELSKFMRSSGVLRLKTPEIEMEIHPAFLEMPKGSEEPVKDESPKDERYSPDDMLFWSVPGEGLPQ